MKLVVIIGVTKDFDRKWSNFFLLLYDYQNSKTQNNIIILIIILKCQQIYVYFSVVFHDYFKKYIPKFLHMTHQSTY